MSVSVSSPPVHSSETTPLLGDRSVIDDAVNVTSGDTNHEALNALVDLGTDSAATGTLQRRQIGTLTAVLMIVNQVVGTGIFATPSTVLGLSGSVGLSLILWIVGGLVSLAGMWTFVVWGTAIPKNGGEANYLTYLFPRPQFLVVSMFASKAIILGSAPGNAVIFGEYVLRAAHQDSPGQWTRRLVGFAALTFGFLLHGINLRWGLHAQNFLGVFKIFVLAIIVLSGGLALGGYLPGPRPDNFHHIFEGTTASASSISLSLYKVIFSFFGFSNINSALSEVKDPKRTLRIAGPVAIGIVSLLYVLANVAYFAASSKEDITQSRELVAALLFRTVWGPQAERVLSLFVAFSALGNIIASMFSWGRVIQQFGRDGIVPYFIASNRPFNAPFAGIGMYWAACSIVIFAFPPGDAYTFVVNIVSYPLSIVYGITSLGIIYLHLRPRRSWPRQGPVALVSAACFGAAGVFLTFAPLARPPPGKEPYEHLPYWVHVAASIGVFALGAAYWTTWARILPWLGGYKLKREETLGSDGLARWVFRRVKVE